MSKIKVIHVISALARGGRERQLATIYQYGVQQDNHSKIIVFNKAKEDYIREYGMNENDLHFLKSKSRSKRLNEIISIIKFEKPDIVYAWGSIESTFCLAASFFTKAKFVNGSVRHGKVLLIFSHLWRLFILHLSRYIVANSKTGLRANLLRRGFVLYNGIDKKFIGETTEEEKLKRRKTRIRNYTGNTVLVSVANLLPIKDYETIIKALSLVKAKGFDFYYFIIGDGPMRKTVENQIDELGLSSQIEILGKISNVKDYLQMADIFVHSSKGEGCSNAILEAMAAGLPVIATDTGGTPEITGERNGHLFQFQDADQLASALEDLMGDKARRNSLGKVSYSIIINRFTIPKMVSDYYNIISQIHR